MKKTLLTLFLAMAVAAGASAAQQTEVDKGDRFDYKYPIFTQENPQAAQRMNRDIQKMVSKSRKDLRHPDMRAVGSNYEVIYENDQFVCLTFNTWYYYDKAAHGMYYTHGIVYDKATGKRVPYTRFMEKLNAEQLKQDIKAKKLPVYCADLKSVSEAPFIDNIDNFKVSKDYIITEDGHLYLMYQPYELDCYAAGVTYVKVK